MNSFAINLDRCVCVHSFSQIIDITIQLILYQREIVPEPVYLLLQRNSERIHNFKAIYSKVVSSLQDVYTSLNRSHIKEFIILIGPFAYQPKEIYKIPLPSCKEHSGKLETSNCGENCADLSAKEKLSVFKSVILDLLTDMKPVSKTDRVFFFVSSSSPLTLNVDSVEEDQSFELPSLEMITRRKIHELLIRIDSPCGETPENCVCYSEDEGSNFWSRILPFFEKLIDC